MYDAVGKVTHTLHCEGKRSETKKGRHRTHTSRRSFLEGHTTNALALATSGIKDVLIYFVNFNMYYVEFLIMHLIPFVVFFVLL